MQCNTCSRLNALCLLTKTTRDGSANAMLCNAMHYNGCLWQTALCRTCKRRTRRLCSTRRRRRHITPEPSWRRHHSAVTTTVTARGCCCWWWRAPATCCCWPSVTAATPAARARCIVVLL
jgi:hypothetical protein